MIGVSFLAVLVLAGLLALLGPGPLSGGTAETAAGSLSVDYLRYPRYLQPHSLALRVPATGREQVRIWIGRDYLDAFYVQRVIPEPASVEALADRLVYAFDVAEGARSISITFDLRSHRIGPARGMIGLETGDTVAFRQLPYP